MTPVRTVVASAEARDRLSSYLKAFREQGERAEPVVFGSHRKPEGVILSYQRYERLIEFLDDLAASEEVREALAKDTGKRAELSDVARESGFDPPEFDIVPHAAARDPWVSSATLRRIVDEAGADAGLLGDLADVRGAPIDER